MSVAPPDVVPSVCGAYECGKTDWFDLLHMSSQQKNQKSPMADLCPTAFSAAIGMRPHRLGGTREKGVCCDENRRRRTMVSLWERWRWLYQGGWRLMRLGGEGRDRGYNSLVATGQPAKCGKDQADQGGARWLIKKSFFTSIISFNGLLKEK